jgi:3-oxoacyl-[acyl-carrier-protein] synthase-3
LSERLPFCRDVGILGTGSCLGSRVIDNRTLQPLVANYDAASGDFDAWVQRVTHIQERRFCGPDETVGTMASEAARRAVEAAKIDPETVDLVLIGTFTPRELYPGDHVQVAHSINGHCGAVTVNGGCSGSIYSMAMAYGMVRAGLLRNVVVIGAEQLTGATNYDDPITAILFGDGSGAAVVGRRDGRTGPGGFIDRVVLKHDPSRNIHMENANLLLPPRDLGKHERSSTGRAIVRQFLTMEGGPRVLRNAVNAMAEATVKLLGFTLDDLKDGNPELRTILDEVHLVPHQANGRIVDGLQEKLGLSAERVYRTVYHAGNMSAATNMYTLDHAMRRGNLRREDLPDGRGRVTPCGRPLATGDLVVLVTIGAGYIYGAVGFRVE